MGNYGNSEKARWGIVGTGRMAGWFCSDFNLVENGTLSAVCSRSPENGRQFAKRYDIPQTFTDIDEMLTSGAIDVAYIATPHTSHKSLILKCLDKKMPVLCEKPIVTSLADAEEVVKAARTNNTYLQEAMWTWHLPAIKAAKKWVKDGRIGDLIHFRADFGYPVPFAADAREFDPSDAGGVLREMGVYPVAFMCHFIEKSTQSLNVVHRLAPNGVEDDLTALFDFGDLTAVLSTSLKCRLGNSAELIGTKGHIVIPDFFRAHKAMLFEIDALVEMVDHSRTSSGYEYQAIALGEDLKNGRDMSEVVTLDKSLRTQAMMKKILNKIELPEMRNQ